MIGESFIISWNNKFPKDREFRKKYQIPFGSKQHREINQIDVFFDVLEDKIYKKHIELYQVEKKSLEDYSKTGIWLKEAELGTKEFDNLFDKIEIKEFNQELIDKHENENLDG